ncbi:MAG TPA: aminotransferase class V-fold PLP-dependent enzyme [Gammaproteobacteria bacterium]
MDIEKLRAETPGCRERIHLNNCGASLMPDPVVRAVQAHIALESRIGGYEAADARADEIRAAYRSVADLIGAKPENVAFTENATAAYIQALSSVPFAPGDVVVTTRNDYASNQIQLLSLRRRAGIELVRAPDRPEGGVDAAAAAELIRRRRPKLVCVTHVPTSSGLVQDVAAIGAVCRDEGILYLVDACQSVGQMPVDVRDVHCDFLSATSRKFLRGPRGAGFLYVSDRALGLGLEPLFMDLWSAEWIGPDEYRPARDAKRYENFEFAWALVLGTGEAARYATAIGLDAIRERIRLLADRLRGRLRQIRGLRLLDRGAELCGIVAVATGDRAPGEIVRALRNRGINTSAQPRSSAVLDADDKSVSAWLRLAPHYYNTEDEIDRAADALAEILERR